MTKSNNKFAVIKTGGKQYIVKENDIISVERLQKEVGEKISFPEVLFYSDDDNIRLGTPFLDCDVSAEIIAEEKDKKVRVFKFKKKTGFKKTQGHRQKYTTVKINSIKVKKLKKAASSSTEKSEDINKA